MRVLIALSLLSTLNIVLAVPRRPIVRRQVASSCSCPSDVTVTQIALNTITLTNSLTVSSGGETLTSTADAVTTTTTITSLAVITAASLSSTTITVAPSTSTVSGSATTVNSTLSLSSTLTVCIPTAYKHKRQGPDPTATPTTTAFQTTFSGMNKPVSCICILRQPLQTTTSTSPACNCPAVQTSTVTVTGTTIASETATIVSTSFATSTLTPTSISTSLTGVTSTVTQITTFTVTSSVVTVTTRSTIANTVTYTPTFSSCPTPQASCNNQGLKYAIYPNLNNVGAQNTNAQPGYPGFDPTVFKTRVPEYQNNITFIGGYSDTNSNNHQVNIYNDPNTISNNYFTVNHVGYLFAQISGSYVFTLNGADDIAILWIGSTAYSGYTRDNANIVIFAGGSSPVTYRTDLVAGNYYPIRIMHANAQTAFAFFASVTAPNGVVILSSTSKPSPYLVQYSCDGTSAPPFAPFGSET